MTIKRDGSRNSKSGNILNGFTYRFIPSSSRENPLTLLLLHGTGGNENDLIPLGRELSQSAALLSPRGRVLENGMPRYFRRFAEGVFDLEDLKFRTNELAEFVAAASKEYKFSPASVVAVGYSNGANIAAGMLLLSPKTLAGAILFRAMQPLEPERPQDLSGKSIFLSAGRHDQIISRAQSEKLRELLSASGANVVFHWALSDHSLIQEEVSKARKFVQSHFELH